MVKLIIPNVSFQVRAKHNFKSEYGNAWVELSLELRNAVGKCQWCDKKQKNLGALAGHHSGCVKYNYKHLLDKRIIIVVCRKCHYLLEPWSKIHLDQMLPQLFE